MTWLLDALFTPRRIAVVGASDRPGTLGALLMANLASFPGEVVPLRAGQSLLDVDRPVDLAVVAVPARAASRSSCPLVTSTIPACRNAPPHTASRPARAAVCDAAARAPAPERPDLRTTTGLSAATRRARSTKERPSGRDSSRKHRVRVASSRASASSSSVAVTSQVLPDTQTLANRMPSSRARSWIAMP